MSGASRGPASARTREEYSRRINAALELIDRSLGEEIPLARLAAAACFSPFHFHRIFSAAVGEPPAEYIRRLRLQKAAGLLVADPRASVLEVAMACGFSTSALFCRRFKEHFGASPTAWRGRAQAAAGRKSKNRQQVRKKGKDDSSRVGFHWHVERGRAMKAPSVRVENVAPFRVAYVKHMKGYEDSQGIGEAFQTLFAWAGPRGVLSPDMKVMGISFDDPEITPKDKCRYYACVTVDDRAEAAGEVGVMDVRPGTCAAARFKGSGSIFRDAYGYLYGQWLPSSGWQPDDAPAFEVYIGEPGATGSRMTFEFDLYVPVKPL